ncbi:hypothetical protein FOJ82_02265 [Tessaracoccus rhinocerotis]|uniref:VTT domain-containing protein n=1 Tax=Tessaracoccus rhinocerotis TaxID=1689449 RepID=A0A553K4U1_9ACTN|nr:VTT domain-containing protein [Tessaracoccus rhinocerotis]TRY19730.1 hypothetical protein FOJ82_02265 [Tessaracoccus rhinocerotis]
MEEAFSGFPIGITFILFFLGAMVRGQATYWLGRIITEQSLKRTRPTSGWSKRVHDWLQGDSVGRGAGFIRKFGVAAVPFAYLTVGLQTLIIAAAGVMRISIIAFTIAQVPGALAWATIYTTVGFAVWGAVFGALQGNPVLTALLVLMVVAVIVAIVRRRRRRAAVEAATV